MKEIEHMLFPGSDLGFEDTKGSNRKGRVAVREGWPVNYLQRLCDTLLGPNPQVEHHCSS